MSYFQSVQYSFPRAQRFKRPRTPCSTDYYEPTFFKNCRASGFGYGTKFDFTKTNVYQDGYYNTGSAFDTPSKGSTFGLGRDLVKNRSYVQQKQVPGPGTYYNTKYLTQKGYSIGHRLHTAQAIENPGPGSYEVKNKRNRGFSINGGPDRFATESTFIPGPGEYNTTKAKDASKIRFGSAKRTCFIDDAIKAAEKLGSPGPGNYEQISQFIRQTRPQSAKQ